MRTQVSFRYIIEVAILIALAGLGAYIAFITYQYKVVTRGIMSLLVFYLVIRLAWITREPGSDALFIFPKNLKYFFSASLFTIIFYWGLGFIVEMILFLVD